MICLLISKVQPLLPGLHLVILYIGNKEENDIIRQEIVTKCKFFDTNQ